MAIAAGALIDVADFAELPAAKHEVSTLQQLPAAMGPLVTPVQVSLTLPRSARVLVILSGIFGEGGGVTTDLAALATEISGTLARSASSTNRALRGMNYVTLQGGSFVEYLDSPAGTLDLEVYGQGVASPFSAVRGVALSAIALAWIDL